MHRTRQLTIFTRKQTLYQSKVTQLPMLLSNVKVQLKRICKFLIFQRQIYRALNIKVILQTCIFFHNHGTSKNKRRQTKMQSIKKLITFNNMSKKHKLSQSQE